MIINLAKTPDAKMLSAIHDVCFPESWSVDYFENVLSDSRFICFKIEYDKKIVGFSLCLNIFPEMELLSICVLPEFQHTGLGKLLINNLINYASANQINTIFLEVAENNANAIKLYEHAGFVSIGRRTGYYIYDGKSTDAILYQYSG